MAEITIEWDDAEETIIRATFVGRYTWEEYFQSQEQGNAMVESKAHRCDLIVDLSRARATSAGPALTNAKKTLELAPTNLGLVVVITSTLANIIIKAFRRPDPVLAARVLTTTQLAQARQLIAMSRAEGIAGDAIR